MGLIFWSLPGTLRTTSFNIYIFYVVILLVLVLVLLVLLLLLVLVLVLLRFLDLHFSNIDYESKEENNPLFFLPSLTECLSPSLKCLFLSATFFVLLRNLSFCKPKTMLYSLLTTANNDLGLPNFKRYAFELLLNNLALCLRGRNQNHCDRKRRRCVLNFSNKEIPG